MDLAGILPLASQGPPRQLAGAGTPSLPGGCMSPLFAAASSAVKSEAASPAVGVKSEAALPAVGVKREAEAAVGVKGEAEAGSLESSQSQSQPDTQLRELGGGPSGQSPAWTATKSEPALMEAQQRGPQASGPKLESA